MKKYLVIIVLMLSANAYADCSRQNMQGEYAASWTIDTDLFTPLTISPTYMVARVIFNANGKVRVANGTGSTLGFSKKFTGGGSFNVSANCSGTASINLRNNEDFSLKLQLYFIAAGSQADTAITATFSSKDDGKESGHLHLRKINL